MRTTSLLIFFVLTASLGFAQNTRLESFGLKGPVSMAVESSYDKASYDKRIFPLPKTFICYFFNKNGQLSFKTDYTTKWKYKYDYQGVCTKIQRFDGHQLSGTTVLRSKPPVIYYKKHEKGAYFTSCRPHSLNFYMEKCSRILFGRYLYGYFRVDSLDRITELAEYRRKDKDTKEKYIRHIQYSYDSVSIKNAASVIDAAKGKYNNSFNTTIQADRRNNWTGHLEDKDSWLNGKETFMHFRLIDYDWTDNDSYIPPILDYLNNDYEACKRHLRKAESNFRWYRIHTFERSDYKGIRTENKPRTRSEARKCEFRVSKKPLFSIDWNAVLRDSIKGFENSGQLIKYLRYKNILYSDIYYQDIWQMGVTIDKSGKGTKYICEHIPNNNQKRLFDLADKNVESWFLVRLGYDRVCYLKGADIICVTADEGGGLILSPLVEVLNEYVKGKKLESL